MTTPVDPTQNVPSMPPPEPSQPSAPPVTSEPTSYMDPTGAWAAFLSTPGSPASAQDVQMFMESLMRFFNVIIQQQSAAMQEANQKLKESFEGED